MKKHIYDEKNGLSYTLQGDYYLPVLVLPEETATYGKYGMLHRRFLEEYKKGIYSTLLIQGRLVEHLNQIDQEANEMLELLMKQMAVRQDVTEQLKEDNQMEWVRLMNNIKSAVEEVILQELIYV